MRVLNKKIWPYQIEIFGNGLDDYTEISDWLTDTIHPYTWINRHISTVYCFTTEQDAMYFSLKWL